MKLFTRSEEDKFQDKIRRNFSKLIAPTVWISFSKLYRLESESSIVKRSDIFNDEFFDKLSARKLELEKSYWGVFTVSVAITFLLASRFFGNIEATVLGISIKGLTGFREPLLFAAAILGFVMAFQRSQLDRIEVLLKVASKHKAGETESSIYFLKWADIIGIDLFVPNGNRKIFGWKIQKFFLVVELLSLVVFLVILFVAALSVHIITLYDIYTSPSTIKWISYAVFFAVIVADIFAIMLMLLFHIPLPNTDYSVSSELADLKKENEEAYDKKIAELNSKATAMAVKSMHPV